jgi:hypothetical protein
MYPVEIANCDCSIANHAASQDAAGGAKQFGEF